MSLGAKEPLSIWISLITILYQPPHRILLIVSVSIYITTIVPKYSISLSVQRDIGKALPLFMFNLEHAIYASCHRKYINVSIGSTKILLHLEVFFQFSEPS